MTDEMLRSVLDTAHAKQEKDGGWQLPEGRSLTLYASHGGVSLTVGKVERIEHKGGLVRAKTTKGELFVLALEDMFAAALDGGIESASGRKAGFLG